MSLSTALPSKISILKGARNRYIACIHRYSVSSLSASFSSGSFFNNDGRRPHLHHHHFCSSVSFSTTPCRAITSPTFGATTTATVATNTTITASRRWKQHSAKMGHHRDTLEEMAHRPEREAAKERRQKKKDKKSARKSKKGGGGGASDASGGSSDTAAAVAVAKSDDDTAELFGSDDYDHDDDYHDDEHEDDDGAYGGDGSGEGDEEPSLPDTGKVKARMMTVVDKFEESLKSIRGAEPTPEMFDDVQVNAYGSMTPLKAVGQVVIVSNTLAQITCFDPSVAKDVQKAVQLALELNPQSGDEPGLIRVPLPRVSMEVREQTAKQLQKKHEKVKQRIRGVRRKAMDVVKKGKDGKLSGISKDDAFASGKDVDAVTEEVMDTLKVVVDAKMDSIMAV
mmetsp:Transcript_56871/g.138446  ORF Transcript_56871/g.138446 Transcript_56871/m.138446 type:complete len:396 (-) Transcript_56871:795-1982(-)